MVALALHLAYQQIKMEVDADIPMAADTAALELVVKSIRKQEQFFLEICIYCNNSGSRFHFGNE